MDIQEERISYRSLLSAGLKRNLRAGMRPLIMPAEASMKRCQPARMIIFCGKYENRGVPLSPGHGGGIRTAGQTVREGQPHFRGSWIHPS